VERPCPAVWPFTHQASPVDSTRLSERKTDHGNGVTRHPALISGRSDEEGTTWMQMSSRIPQEANATGRARGYADVGTMTGRKEARVGCQRRRHPEAGTNLILRVRVGASCPGASSSNMCTDSKSASFELVNMAIPKPSTHFRRCSRASRAARLLAVRRVTQDNQGKNTAGVDGVKAVLPQQRLVLTEQIHPKRWEGNQPRPVRRVWIPKPGKTEKRPLGMPMVRSYCPPYRVLSG